MSTDLTLVCRVRNAASHTPPRARARARRKTRRTRSPALPSAGRRAPWRKRSSVRCSPGSSAAGEPAGGRDTRCASASSGAASTAPRETLRRGAIRRRRDAQRAGLSPERRWPRIPFDVARLALNSRLPRLVGDKPAEPRMPPPSPPPQNEYPRPASYRQRTRVDEAVGAAEDVAAEDVVFDELIGQLEHHAQGAEPARRDAFLALQPIVRDRLGDDVGEVAIALVQDGAARAARRPGSARPRRG